MRLQKQPIQINFQSGLDLKTDPNQVPIGKFLGLTNSVFTTIGRLTKRNGFGELTQLPDTQQTNLMTYNGNLVATGSNLNIFSQDSNQWINQGVIQPIQLRTQSLIRSSTSQTSPDTAVSALGLTCMVYMDNSVGYYHIIDSNTGQQIVPRTLLNSTATNPRVMVLGTRFIITFIYTDVVTPTLAYIAIPIALPTNPSAIVQISAQVSSITAAYDITTMFNTMYFAWNASDGSIKLQFMTQYLIQSNSTSITATQADLISLNPDITNNTIWLNYWTVSSGNGFVTAYYQNLAAIALIPTATIVSQSLKTMTAINKSGIMNLFYEVNNTYSYSPNAVTDYVETLTCNMAGTVTSPIIVLRSVGLASKPFINAQGTIMFMVAYGETNQPTYYLVDNTGAIYMHIAYSNGGGYANSFVLPEVSIQNDIYYIPYLITDFLATVNKNTNNPSGTPTAAIFTQTGVNLAIFTLNDSTQYNTTIADTLHLTGGQLWMYDSVKPVEHGFNVWPENITGTTSGSGGLITANTYFYQFTYEWTDNQGNLHRSAPSIPLEIITTGATSTNTINVPTLRLTAKIAPNPVRIVGYRWSAAQEVYYQFTSLTSPTLNDPSMDSVTFTDTKSDAQILGNTILYTTGGVIENIIAPGSIASCLFNNRLVIVDAEDQNLLWFSKQVIENVPVEMSDLLTVYVSPTSGAQGSTGPITALSAMDDKLIIFKKDAIYYITGNGPDNTGANNDFSEPIFITSSVGCANPNSIVLTPTGLMFQSDKGIWLLGRDLGTKYIGDGVEFYNNILVASANTIPGTNQVRFVLVNDVTLMFDYYEQQWGAFSNLEAISATLYQGLHTYLNKFGVVYQETPGKYLDGSKPVLINLTTAWINAAGLKGYERFYFMYLLGTYFTPFKLLVSLAYDYNENPAQTIMVTPDNFSGSYGDDLYYGDEDPYGGPANPFQARIFPKNQKCQTFQVSIQEIYDSSLGVAAGQGLSLSGMNLIVGIKKGYSPQKASRTFG